MTYFRDVRILLKVLQFIYVNTGQIFCLFTEIIKLNYCVLNLSFESSKGGTKKSMAASEIPTPYYTILPPFSRSGCVKHLMYQA